MRRRLPNSGFTLPDLLAVIAILAILTAVLFPVFARAREKSEKSKETACLSNLKQLGLGMIQYSQDYDESFPCGVNPDGGGNGWAGALYPYVKDPNIFVCPSDTTTASSKGVNFSSYGYNSQFVPPPASYGHPVAATLAQLASPYKTVLCFEVVASNGYTVTDPDRAPTTALVAPSDDYAPYHGGSAAGYGVGGPFDPSGFNSNAGVSGGTSFSLKYATGILRNSRPGSAKRDFSAATGRHMKGANYLTADGHVQFLLPAHVSGGYPNTDTSGTDCGGTDGSNAYDPLAAQTQCPESGITATFNLQ